MSDSISKIHLFLTAVRDPDLGCSYNLVDQVQVDYKAVRDPDLGCSYNAMRIILTAIPL